MDFMYNIKPGTKNINRYFIILIVIWTSGVFATLGWDIYQLKHSTTRLANISAEISYNKDVLYRAKQGYKEGDIRGGINISIPMEPLRSLERSQINDALIAYSFLWLLGIGGIAVSTRHLWKQLVYREKIEKEVITLSITDQLTGLYNRRGFMTFADRQLKLAGRNKNGMMLFFADLDGLKDINDRLGHKEGDKALIEAASVFRETFRTSDIIARLGGDEFAALAIDMKEENPEIFTSRLDYLIEKQNEQENRTYKLSISIGGSFQDPENPRSIDELISQADKLMYEQKKQKKASSS
ncbi:MAG: GGDEF domain-containing protein [Desulfobacterales bacterium]